ncbi:hypothetical protein B0H63DRAFT_459975 [Podospora didyma]|uniref:UBX domain-containing protein n=1 Tax=Podospora didyma TaxID=330526 RepID=A0AAE0P6A9_9PEZI|nr:hypothetical protein B0H63DRAFT_459975 [Podospora didyma]
MAFFQGTLVDGIALALQQSRSIVCFVTDGRAEAQQWENEYLMVDDVVSLLRNEAVTLRLEAGSVEEGQLKSFYPIPKTPVVIVIKNAELKEYIASGVSEDDFLRRLRGALQPAPAAPGQAPAPGAQQPAARQPEPVVETPAPVQSQPNSESNSSGSGQATPPESNETEVQAPLSEREREKAAQIAALQRQREEALAKQQSAEKGKGREEAPAPEVNAQSKHVELLKKKQREARDERQRILKAIEDDKVARRAQQAQREAERKKAKEAEKEISAPIASTSKVLPTTSRPSENCALQVRLFDGSTIRNRFPSSKTLKDVRQWVDEAREDGKDPYTFKILLTPLPSKAIDITEEQESLQALGLTPSSTLILVHVKKYAAAYNNDDQGQPHGNFFSQLIAYILAIVNGFFGVIFSFFSTLLSTGGPPAPHAASTNNPGRAEASGRDGSRRGGVSHRNQGDDRRNDTQFYNGNSTNFEPRRDDDNDDEE